MSARVIVDVFPAADPAIEDWDGSWVEDFERGLCTCANVRAFVEQPLGGGDSRSLELSFTITNRPVWGEDDAMEYATEAFTSLVPHLESYGLLEPGEKTRPDDIRITLSR